MKYRLDETMTLAGNWNPKPSRPFDQYVLLTIVSVHGEHQKRLPDVLQNIERKAIIKRNNFIFIDVVTPPYCYTSEYHETGNLGQPIACHCRDILQKVSKHRMCLQWNLTESNQNEGLISSSEFSVFSN